MLKQRAFTIGIATCLIGSAALAATAPAGQMTAAQDFGKVSMQGATAAHDVALARLAIFDGRTKEAKARISDAEAAMIKAGIDDTVFIKAESELKAPSGMTHSSAGAAPSKTPIRWIPVDGSITLGEDFVAAPDKAAGVAKANQQLNKGQKKEAMETLKLANIDVNYLLEVAPLDKTVSGIQNAAQLMASDKYYEANQALKGVEDGFRFDMESVDAVPKLAAK